MKKGQGLPISTIALIIVVLLVLAGVVFFFFKGFGQGKEGTASVDCERKCRQIRMFTHGNDYKCGDLSTGSAGVIDEYCSGCTGKYNCSFADAGGDDCNINTEVC